MTPEHRGPPALVLPEPVWSTIRRHVKADYPDEGCGILVGVPQEAAWRVTDAVVCENIVDPADRPRRFEIDPRVVLRLQRELRGTGRQILGFYHSHPDGRSELSGTDMMYVRLWPRTVWLVVPIPGGEPGEPRAWWLPGPDAADAVEMALEWGPGPVRPTEAEHPDGLGAPAGARDD